MWNIFVEIYSCKYTEQIKLTHYIVDMVLHTAIFTGHTGCKKTHALLFLIEKKRKNFA